MRGGREDRLKMVEGTVRSFVTETGDLWEDRKGASASGNVGNPICGVSYKPKSQEDAEDVDLVTAFAHLTIVCDGMYSTLRKSLIRDPKIELPSFFVGLLMKRGEGKDDDGLRDRPPLPQPRPRRPRGPLPHPVLPHLLHGDEVPHRH